MGVLGDFGFVISGVVNFARGNALVTQGKKGGYKASCRNLDLM